MQDSPGYLKTKDWGNTVRYFEHNKQFYTHLQKRKEKNGSKKKKTVRQAALCRTKFNENGDTFFRQQEFVAEQIKTHKKCPGPLSLLSARKC